MFTIRSRGKRHHERALRAGFDVRDHERVGVLALDVGSLLGSPNASSLVGVVHELPRVAPDDEEVRTLRRRLRGDQLDALDLLHPRVDLVVDQATTAVVSRRRESTAIRSAPRSRATDLSRDRDMRRSFGSGATARSAALALDVSVRGVRRRPLRATAPWWAWLRCSVGGVEPSPLKSGPEDQHDVGAGQRAVGHEVGAGHHALHQSGPWPRRPVGSGSAWSTRPRAGVVLDAAAHEARFAGAARRCCRRRR